MIYLRLIFELLGSYASIRAIETRSVGDDQQWLTYWVLYSMITLFELTFASLIEWYDLSHLSYHIDFMYLPCRVKSGFIVSGHVSTN